MFSILEAVFGSRSAAQVFLYLQNYGEGHSRAIADTFDAPNTGIQRQLKRLEANGLLVSRMVGNARVYGWNPRKRTVKELREFLEAELSAMPEDLQLKYFRQRLRPRRSGKPL